MTMTSRLNLLACTNKGHYSLANMSSNMFTMSNGDGKKGFMKYCPRMLNVYYQYLLLNVLCQYYHSMKYITRRMLRKHACCMNLTIYM